MTKPRTALLASVLLGGVAAPAAADVIVYAGYLNNLSAFNPADVPTPFDPSATTTLIASGGSSTPHDTGVVRFQNTGAKAVSIDLGVKVTFQNGSFQPWDASLPFTLNPGSNLVLAETVNFNFDSSEFGLGSDPVVAGDVSGNAFSFVDTARILLGREDAINGEETTPYGVLGRIAINDDGGSVPEPGTLALLLGALLLGFPYLRRRH
jgi:hypothetical protein